MMKLRCLEYKDIPGMLEWMHDSSINAFFRFDAASATNESARFFIEKARQDFSCGRNLHYAVTDDADEYLGTVSLKEIDTEAGTAEYAISMRKSAQGTGAAREATLAILDIGFREMCLNRIYLNVLSSNARAISFYQKIGFTYEGTFRDHLYVHGTLQSLSWYSMLKNEWEKQNG